MFSNHVPLTIFLKELPLFWGMLREVPSPAAVPFRWLARDTEIADQGLAGRELLLVLREPNCFTCCVQAGRISAVQPVHHGAAPLV